jgi:hypothetical protein
MTTSVKEKERKRERERNQSQDKVSEKKSTKQVEASKQSLELEERR